MGARKIAPIGAFFNVQALASPKFTVRSRLSVTLKGRKDINVRRDRADPNPLKALSAY